MKIPFSTVEDAGIVIRALRKQSGIRIDDFALTAKVSKQFMTDLENGRPTVGMGRVLGMLQAMGVRISLDVPDAASQAVTAEQERRRLKAAAGKQPKPAKKRRASRPNPPAEQNQAAEDFVGPLQENPLKPFDVVATTEAIPAEQLTEGQHGTVVKVLDASTVLVKFADGSGRCIALAPLPLSKLNFCS